MADEETYEDIVDGTIKEAKQAIEEIESPDFEKIIEAEKANKDRVTFLDWLESQKKQQEPDEPAEAEVEEAEVEEEPEEEPAAEERERISEIEPETPQEVDIGQPIEEAEEEVEEEPEEEPEEEEEEEEEEKFVPPVEGIKYHGRKELSAEEKRIFRKRWREKKQTPNFIRQEYYRMNKLDDKWKRPRGQNSKQMIDQRGKPKAVKVGYKKSKETRFLHPMGYYPVRVHNPDDLSKIDNEKEGAIIASSVGRRKRNEIIRRANELEIAILNPRKGEIPEAK